MDAIPEFTLLNKIIGLHHITLAKNKIIRKISGQKFISNQ